MDGSMRLTLLLVALMKMILVTTSRSTQEECAFPFIYKGVKYEHCTNVGMEDPKVYWCSLDHVYKGYVAFCKNMWKHELLNKMDDLKRNMSAQQLDFEILRNKTASLLPKFSRLKQWIAHKLTANMENLRSQLKLIRHDIREDSFVWSRKISLMQKSVQLNAMDVKRLKQSRLIEYHKRLLRILSSIELNLRRAKAIKRSDEENNNQLRKRLILIVQRLSKVESRLEKIASKLHSSQNVVSKSESLPVRTSDGTTQRTSDGTTKRTFDGTTKRTFDETTKRTFDGTTKRTFDGTTKRTFDGTTKRTFDGTTKRTFDGTTQRTFDGTTKGVFDDKMKKIFDDKIEDLWRK